MDAADVKNFCARPITSSGSTVAPPLYKNSLLAISLFFHLRLRRANAENQAIGRKCAVLLEHRVDENMTERPLGDNPGDFHLMTASARRLFSLCRNSAVRDDSISGRASPEAAGVITVMEEEENSE